MIIRDNGPARKVAKPALVMPDIDGIAKQRDIAYEYEAAGFPVHPWIKTRTKISARGKRKDGSGEEFHFNGPEVIETPKMIGLWAARWQVGFACSWRTGFIAIDVDDPEEFDQWDIAQGFPATVKVATGRDGGYHLYLDCRHLKAVIPQDEWPRQGDIPGGTLKTNGFVAAPGSHHPNGKLYRVQGRRREVARGSLKLVRALTAYRNTRAPKALGASPGYVGELLARALGAEDNEQHGAVLTLVNSLEREMTREAYRGFAVPLLLRALRSYDEHDPWDERGLMEMIGSKHNRVGATIEQEKDLAEIGEMGPNISTPPEEEAFWTSREELITIRQWAQAQMVSPWALLAEVLTEVIARVPPTFVLPDIVGGYGSLNMLFAITGDSAAGKGGAAAMVGNVLRVDEPLGPDGRPFRDMIPEREQAGSGEGLAENYAYYSSKESCVKRKAFTSIITAYEVSTLEALMSRGSATIGGELKKLFMGEPLGFGYKGPRRIPIKRYTYRGVLTAGVQPEMSGVIVNDYASGWSQRWMFFNANDPYAPSESPERPDPLKWTLARELQELGLDTDSLEAGKPCAVAEVCETAVNEIRSVRLPGLRGTLSRADKLKGHRLFTQEKFAIGLGILNGRMDLNEEDWALAAYAMLHSDSIRKLCEREVRKAGRRKATAEGITEGHRKLATETVIKRESDKKLWDLILDHLPAGERKTANQLGKEMPHRRDELDGALAEMVPAKKINVVKRPYNGKTYTYYARPGK